jgi:AcrR family transcriptional regulator
MPTFTDAKRERVRESLRNTGRELFARHGIRKTTISELTEAVGIGHGTFYQFYDSKEELYIDILEAYTEELLPRLLSNSFEEHDDPEDAIAAFLELSLDEIESNPFFQQIIVEDDLDLLREQYSEEEAENTGYMKYILPYIEQWYDDGRVTGPDPETVAHAIDAMGYLTLHVEDIGEDRYPAVRDTLIAAVAVGLTDKINGTVPTGDTNE